MELPTITYHQKCLRYRHLAFNVRFLQPYAIMDAIITLGLFFTTNKRVWEYDSRFKKYLSKTRAMAIDMETATIFITGFANEIPTGALLLVSDQPMISTGVKTEKSDKSVTEKFAQDHLQIGIDAMAMLRDNDRSVKHLKFFDE